MTTKKLTSAQLNQMAATFVDEWREKGLEKFQAFRNWAVQQILWESNLSDLEVEQAVRVDGSGDRGIDAWHVSEGESGVVELNLVQAKDTSLEEADIEKLVSGFSTLFPAVSSNSPFTRANQDIQQEARTFQTDYLEDSNVVVVVNFYLVTSTKAPSSTRKRASETATEITLDIGSDHKKTVEATVEIFDIVDLVEKLGLANRPTIPFRTEVPGDSYLENSSSFKSTTLIIDAQEIADLYNKHKIELFRNNPRYFQSKRTAVNRGMMETLEDPAMKDMFYIYNNGLTATCDSYVVEKSNNASLSFDANQTVTISCENFQIVNGCQTTVTLYNSSRSDKSAGLDGVKVQLKIIESPASIAPTVSRFTNSQNMMKAEDFRTNDPIHLRLQRSFKSLTTVDPWFYEYKRGEWGTDYSRAPERQPFKEGTTRYKTRKFQMKDLAQACLSFLGDPRTANDSVSSIFNNAKTYKQVFPDDVSELQLLLPRIIFLEIENFISERTEEYDSSWALYLKFRATYLMARLLATLISPNTDIPNHIDYFERATSEKLIKSIPDWIEAFCQEILPPLKDSILDKAKSSDITPRQQVRKSDWLIPTSEAVLRNVMSKLKEFAEAEAESDGALPKNSLGILKKFPITVAL